MIRAFTRALDLTLGRALDRLNVGLIEWAERLTAEARRLQDEPVPVRVREEDR